MPNQSRWENRPKGFRTADPFILESTFLAKGGPARHLHYDQDEWFYCPLQTPLFLRLCTGLSSKAASSLTSSEAGEELGVR